jgi:glycerol 3-phosphatase-1
MEGLLPKHYGDDASEIPGARLLLDSVIAKKVPWAVGILRILSSAGL